MNAAASSRASVSSVIRALRRSLFSARPTTLALWGAALLCLTASGCNDAALANSRLLGGWKADDRTVEFKSNSQVIMTGAVVGDGKWKIESAESGSDTMQIKVTSSNWNSLYGISFEDDDHMTMNGKDFNTVKMVRTSGTGITRGYSGVYLLLAVFIGLGLAVVCRGGHRSLDPSGSDLVEVEEKK